MCGIYKITNTINGKCYIGQSTNINKRWNNHKCYKSQHKENWSAFPLYRAIEKYGIENFTFEVLEECFPEQLNEKEVQYIKEYNSFGEGYNQTSGGDGTCNSCVKLTENQVFEIYDLLRADEMSQDDIAEKFNVGKDIISTINHGKSRYHAGIEYPVRKNLNKYKPNQGKVFCVDCGIEIYCKSTRCNKCAQKLNRKVERPSKEGLQQLIYEKSLTEIGRMYGISDNSVRKWCKDYGLPYRTHDIKKVKSGVPMEEIDFTESTKTQIDEKKICDLYLQNKSLSRISKETKHDAKIIKRVLISAGIFQETSPTPSNPCSMIDKNTGVILNNFSSQYEAAKYLITNNLTNAKLKDISTHIAKVCKGKRKTAYGFIWSITKKGISQ